MKNIIKLATAGALILGAASCSDFLDRPAEDTYNVSNFYQNDAQCIQGVNYLYNSPWYDFQRAFLWVGEVMSGNLYFGDSQYLDLSVNGTDTDLVNMSYSLWAVNGHANTVIDNILNVENCFVYSIGTITYNGEPRIVSLGLLNHVFTVDEEKARQMAGEIF